MESSNVIVDKHYKNQSISYDREPAVEMIITEPTMPQLVQDTETVTSTQSENSTMTDDQNSKPEVQKTPRYLRLNHFEDQIIGDKNKGVMTRRRLGNEEVCIISQIAQAYVIEACKDKHWLKAMEDELDETEKNETWTLVSTLR